MPLNPGTRLGPYEILAPLGAGGMGEVYRARDSRLGRDVAIKVLAQHLSSSPEVRARFEREAKTVSSLNHPHICVLYDVGREGDTDYLVLELVEGETLASRLSRGPLPPADVLRLGAQIADALDRAHHAGVVHRDLKPGNVMLTRAGVKLMDFGLARAVGLAPADASGSAMTQSPTMAQPLTAQGTIVGTFQYMSPEQLEGKEPDARGDIWALGCVLYEMATGRRAFEGRSQASLIASIMNTEPTPLTQLAPLSPPELHRLVRACLAKDPEDRIQTAHDVKLQLQWTAESGSRTTPAVAERKRLGGRLGWIAAGVLLLVVGGLSAQLMQKPVSRSVASWVSILPPESANIGDDEVELAISPDASAVVFVATDSAGLTQLWLRDLSGLESKPLPGTQQATMPFWSPDSRFIGFFSDGQLKKVDRMGRAVQSLCEAPDGRGGTWSSHGMILFAPSSSGGLSLVSEGGGPSSKVTSVDSTRTGHRFPTFLPDGRHFLFVSLGTGSPLTMLGSLDGGTPQRLMVSDAGGGAAFAAPDHVIFFRSGTLLAQRLDIKRGRLLGEPKTLGQAAGAVNYAGSPPVSVSKNGVMIQRHRFPTLVGLSWLNREGQRLGTIPTAPAPYQDMSLSPDDDYVALTRFSSSGSDIWTVELSRGVATRLTSDFRVALQPMWSPDGNWIAFSAMTSATGRNVYRVRPKGAGTPETYEATFNSSFLNCAGWSPDGRYLLLRVLDKDTGEDIWLRREDQGDHKPVPLLQSRYQDETPRLSPNGRWLAYRSDESGRSELYVASFPSLDLKHRISPNGAGTQSRSEIGWPFWGKDGKELIYVGGDGVSVIAVPVETVSEFRMGTPHVLFRLPPGTRDMVATSDLQKFLILEDRGLKEQSSIQMLVNWPAAMNER